ncbi:MAG: NAD+ synthase [Chitinophagales bacterium]|nr:NAD+ synthase [Chitinophagales bacterium]
MKIALAQLNFHVGNFDANTAKILEACAWADKLGADLIVFSELCICGYPARDFLDYPHFIQACSDSLKKIADANFQAGIIVGAPVKNPSLEGKDLFNAAVFIHQGRMQQIFCKTLLPTYDVFDEYRYFEPNRNFNLLHFKGKKIAVTVCEDIWNVGNENPLYTIAPMDELITSKPDFAINISASPFSYIQHRERLKILKANVSRYKIPLIYVNQVGAQTELIFDGGSTVMLPGEKIAVQLPFFEEKLQLFDLEEASQPGSEKIVAEVPLSEIALIHKALVCGIKDYFAKLGFKKAIIGLSGGVDSAVVAVLAAEALGNENLLCLLMPSEFSSEHSVTDARQLCHNLNISYEIISIQPVFETLKQLTRPYFKNLPFDVTEENMQSRARAILLMAFCNKFGYILLNTTNKSEAAVGYGTLYGDMCGGLCVIGDLYKTRVYELASYINREQQIIPGNILLKPPSAELRPNQKDTDSLPEYS